MCAASLFTLNLKADENSEKKIVEQVMVEGKILDVSNFYIGDVGIAAYETHESKDFKACSEVLVKLAGFVASEARLSRKPKAASMLERSAASLTKLAARLLIKRSPSIDQIELPLAQIDRGLELSYGVSAGWILKAWTGSQKKKESSP
ncbi:MAG: hypothetical protein ACSHYB_17720 [Roseibacillus sp.]